MPSWADYDIVASGIIRSGAVIFNMQQRDVVVIGAGASGLFCAIEAGKRGRSVTVLDHGPKAGRKVRVSGGGFCNFTNLHSGPDAYLSGNPEFCRSALSRFTPQDFLALLDRHVIAYEERGDGRLFTLEGAWKIQAMLEDECRMAGVDIRLLCVIKSVSKRERFFISTGCGDYSAAALVVATGGLSCPALGATGFGHRLARRFGLGVAPLRPGLVPLVFGGRDLKNYRDLSGISFRAAVRCGNKRFEEGILFTHKGLSGPAMLQASLYWDRGEPVVVDLFPEKDAYSLLVEQRHIRTALHNLLSGYLPRRFAELWCGLAVKSLPLNRYADAELREIGRRLNNWEIIPAGTEGYGTAEVTVGGVGTDELSSKTMESRKVPGLYFIGEVVDVTGRLGGYNLQWAWSSGYAAGQYA